MQRTSDRPIQPNSEWLEEEEEEEEERYAFCDRR